jgi:diguanylate cyclase (GGDEF)-like protein
MLSYEQIVKNLPIEVLIIEKDETGKIIRPSDKEELSKTLKILRGCEKLDGLFYNKSKDTWYNIVEKEIAGHKVSYIMNYNYAKVLERKAQTDSLTTLSNKELTYNKMDKYLEDEIAKNNNSSFSVVMFDIDNFKSINDRYGHMFGDEVLTKIGTMISSSVDTYNSLKGTKNIAGRFGGDEFFILVKDIDEKETYKRINILKNKLKKTTIRYEDKDIALPNISVGYYNTSIDKMAAYDSVDDIRSIACKRADKALYASKKVGKDLVTNYRDIEDTKKLIKREK